MNILVTGGTGLIGQALISRLASHSISVLTRNVKTAKKALGENISFFTKLEDIDFNTIDVVVNLAGEPIADKRWTKGQKHRIAASRLRITRTLVEKINEATSGPQVFISGSAIGYYGRQPDNITIEESHPTPFNEFSHTLCSDWENTAFEVKQSVRTCIVRTGIVLHPCKGALRKLLPSFKFGLGSVIGSGTQGMSWIHINDMANAIIHLIQHKECDGIFNLTAPSPVSNRVFSNTLAQQLHRPCLFTMPAFVMRLLFGEMADLLLFGQYVTPKRLIQSGYKFEFSELDGALKDLLNNT
ncbi:Cell division inhibitor [Pseudoalteromonas luteoviolacea B = ATCC 29581]|nr:Cell division inhibitor [Pseudoalteromonas luteoviolacea B = ATCC 29581]